MFKIFISPWNAAGFLAARISEPLPSFKEKKIRHQFGSLSWQYVCIYIYIYIIHVYITVPIKAISSEWDHTLTLTTLSMCQFWVVTTIEFYRNRCCAHFANIFYHVITLHPHTLLNWVRWQIVCHVRVSCTCRPVYVSNCRYQSIPRLNRAYSSLICIAITMITIFPQEKWHYLKHAPLWLARIKFNPSMEK